MDKIKPHHWLNPKGIVWRRKPPREWGFPAYYDQSAIDALRAEVEKHKARADFWQLAKSSDFHRDAMRYRWFRAGLEANHVGAYDIAECAYRGGLDAAIDAAMQGDAR